MYAMHGSDFVSQFIGVHNVLRATVSEHPQFNVWYYYSAIFLAGFIPWVFTLPLAWRDYGLTRKIAAAWREKRLRLSALSMKTQFLIVWAATIFVTYQLMATKYMTYTFPYMIPLAIGFASYLKKYDRLVLNMAGIVLAIYVAATCTVIVPQCQQASAYDAAQVVSGLADNETAVVTYGGRYPVSLTYYSNHPAYRWNRLMTLPINCLAASAGMPRTSCPSWLSKTCRTILKSWPSSATAMKPLPPGSTGELEMAHPERHLGHIPKRSRFVALLKWPCD